MQRCPHHAADAQEDIDELLPFVGGPFAEF